MEVDDIQMQRCKFARIGNGKKSDLNKTGKVEEEKFLNGGVGGSIGGVGGGRFFGWPASRIVRVSKASGGKDRHSKVWTSKGLRDRRVRLSVTTAIQFYDLQDRLGYDQPSKAVEWLIKAAADAIDDLPTINTSYPGTPKQVSDGKPSNRSTEQGIESLELELDQQQKLSMSKSACSSNSETSKGSGNLSLSRTKSRDKARERAKERMVVREKERVSTESVVAGDQEMNPISQSSFTDLLSGHISNVNSYTHYFKKPQTWSSSAPLDYFSPVSLSNQSSGFSDQIQMGNSMSHPLAVSPFTVTGDHFSFVPPEHFAPVTTSCDNLNFTISSGYAGFSRGTLQSNSHSLFSNDQRVSSIDRSNMPFFIGNSAPSPTSMENQHQFSAGIDGPLQLCYGNGGRNSDKEGDKY